MSRIRIESYLSRIEQLRRVSGLSNEVVVSQAFARLLEDWARDQKLLFVQQHPFTTPQKSTVRPDGAVLDDTLRVPLGWWEAKDTADDLDREIEKKLRKGYPQNNIVFENGATAVLIQNRAEVIRCTMTDVPALERLLSLFFAYEPPEIAEFRKAVEKFKTDLPAILDGLRAAIATAYAENPPFAEQAARFLTHAKDTINPSLVQDDVREMLIQHILTEEIFTQVFNDSQYHRENNIARELTRLEDAFFTGGVKRDVLRAMQPYYAAIKANAAQIGGHSEKQKFLKAIYEGFYKVYNPKAADRLGVVYTPNEIVRFMIEGADWLCHTHFGKTLIEPGVEILDPATGTGTFICELIQHFSGQPAALHRKYKEELHANEVAILPYYVANLNIEATYAAVAGRYAEFPNLCFVDTLDNVAGLGVRKGTTPDLFGALSDENIARVKRQNLRKISVVIGNPPYNAWQENFNQRNANRSYRKIDQRIKETYILKGSAQNQNSVYDMYTRFFRWAADRVHDDGIIAFIVGRKPVAKGAYDGFRRDVFDEFAEVYVVDLGGDAIDNPKLSGTKHNVFGNRSGVAIYFLVKRHGAKGCKVFYARRDENDTKEDKLAWLGSTPMSQVKFERITPDRKGNWIGQTENEWEDLLPVVSKEVKGRKKGASDGAIFRTFTNGIQTKKDEWLYDFDEDAVSRKTQWFFEQIGRIRRREASESELKWDREIERRYNAGGFKVLDSEIVLSSFRPFTAKFLRYDPSLISVLFKASVVLPFKQLFNAPAHVIGFHGMNSTQPFAALSVVAPFDICLLKTGNGSSFGIPRYRYTPSGERIDNITDWALTTFTGHYGKTAGVTRDGIFAYVYAALHDPHWRETYAINLKREFPRIPLHPNFGLWAGWGQRLLDLHIGYEGVAPWPVTRRDTPDARARSAGLSPKVILKSDPLAGTVTLDSETVISGIPPAAWDYRLGNRSAIDWVLDQHKEKTPKDPTIRARFNTYRFAGHKERVAGLLARVVRVSVETQGIVAEIAAARRG